VVDHVFREVDQVVDHLAKQCLPFNIVLRFLILLITLFPCLYCLTMLVLVFYGGFLHIKMKQTSIFLRQLLLFD
jgi:hypothetical protein